MGKILSQEESAALLGSAREIEREVAREPAADATSEATASTANPLRRSSTREGITPS